MTSNQQKGQRSEQRKSDSEKNDQAANDVSIDIGEKAEINEEKIAPAYIEQKLVMGFGEESDSIYEKQDRYGPIELNEIYESEPSDKKFTWFREGIIETVRYQRILGGDWSPMLVVRYLEGNRAWIPIIGDVNLLVGRDRYCIKCRAAILTYWEPKGGWECWEHWENNLCKKCTDDFRRVRRAKYEQEECWQGDICETCDQWEHCVGQWGILIILEQYQADKKRNEKENEYSKEKENIDQEGNWRFKWWGVLRIVALSALQEEILRSGASKAWWFSLKGMIGTKHRVAVNCTRALLAVQAVKKHATKEHVISTVQMIKEDHVKQFEQFKHLYCELMAGETIKFNIRQVKGGQKQRMRWFVKQEMRGMNRENKKWLGRRRDMENLVSQMQYHETNSNKIEEMRSKTVKRWIQRIFITEKTEQWELLTVKPPREKESGNYYNNKEINNKKLKIWCPQRSEHKGMRAREDGWLIQGNVVEWWGNYVLLQEITGRYQQIDLNDIIGHTIGEWN